MCLVIVLSSIKCASPKDKLYCASSVLHVNCGCSYHHTAAVAMEGGTHKALPLSGDLKALNGV